jgi:hypothetical protein
MFRRVILSASAAVIAVGVVAGTVPVAAQWLKYPTAGIPRTPDGKPNLKAPTPRTRDGKPDFSGMWLTADGPPCPQNTSGQDFIECGIELPISVLGFNMGAKTPGGLPYQRWAADLVKKRTAENSKDDPHARCLPDTFLRAYGLPHIQKFIQVPGLLVMLDEVNAGYRQVFTDGRPLPVDPVPAWNGYSTGTWEGDALLIESIGFRDDLWLDMAGSFITEKATVRERIRRLDYGHLQIEATIDDLKAFTKPWTITMNQRIVVDTELVDEICLENEKSSKRMK